MVRGFLSIVTAKIKAIAYGNDFCTSCDKQISKRSSCNVTAFAHLLDDAEDPIDCLLNFRNREIGCRIFPLREQQGVDAFSICASANALSNMGREILREERLHLSE